MFREQFEGRIFNDVAIDGNAVTTNFTPGNSAADAKLLSDKFIKSHVCDLACNNTEIGHSTRKRELLSAQYSGLTISLKEMIHGILFPEPFNVVRP